MVAYSQKGTFHLITTSIPRMTDGGRNENYCEIDFNITPVGGAIQPRPRRYNDRKSSVL